MAGFVGKLEVGETLSAAPYLAGPWREFSRASIRADEEYRLEGADAEYAVIVTAGDGLASVGEHQEPFNVGSAFVVGLGSNLRLRAGTSRVELFVTTVDAH